MRHCAFVPLHHYAFLFVKNTSACWVGVITRSLMQTCSGRAAQKNITSAMSSAVSALTPLYTALALSASPLKRTIENSVSAIPGAICVTLMLCFNRSILIDLVRESTADFVAQ